VPERSYAFEPPLTKTARRSLRQGGRHRRARRSLHRGARGGRAQSRLAGVNVLGPGREVSAHTKVINLAVARQTAKAALERFTRDAFP
jgi:hypothetical protein